MTKTRKMPRVITVLLSLLLAVSLVSAGAISAFADDSTIETSTPGSLTIFKLDTNSGIEQTEYDALDATEQAKYVKADNGKFYIFLNGAEYTVYKIGTIEQSTSDPFKVTYQPIPGLKDKNGAAISEITSTTNADDIAYSGLTAVAGPTTTAGTGQAVFNFNTSGDVYLVVESSTPPGYTTAKNFIVTIPMTDEDANGASYWNYDITAYPKNSKNDASLEKTVDKINDETVTSDTNDFTASRGDTISYSVDVKFPSDFTTANYTSFKVIDTPSQYLLIDSSTVKVFVGGTEITTGFTTSYASGTLTVDFTVPGAAGYNSAFGDGTEVKITYNAKLAADTPLNTPIKNNVKISYTTDTNTTPEIIEPEPDPTDPPIPSIYTYGYGLQKLDEKNVFLPGAKFVIKNSSGNYMQWVAGTGWITTNDVNQAYVVETKTNGTGNEANAIVTFEGLAKGSYTIVEIQAPTGYTLLKSGISVTIDKDSTDQLTAPGYSIQVVNTLSAGELPSTGGAGIYIFLIIGAVLITTGIILSARFIKKKKNNVA